MQSWGPGWTLAPRKTLFPMTSPQNARILPLYRAIALRLRLENPLVGAQPGRWLPEGMVSNYLSSYSLRERRWLQAIQPRTRDCYTHRMLLCSVRGCHLALARDVRRMVCPRKHSFDIARSGYINLLQPQERRAKQPGDTAEAISARRRLHDRGFTEHQRLAIAEAIARHSRRRGSRCRLRRRFLPRYSATRNRMSRPMGSISPSRPLTLPRGATQNASGSLRMPIACSPIPIGHSQSFYRSRRA